VAELCRAEGCVPRTEVASIERQWLAAYTRSQHEHSVGSQLRSKAVEFLLPQYTKTSRWSDRIKRALTPLFPSYVFVYVSPEERIRVLQTAGVVSLIGVGGKPVPLRADEVAMLRECAVRPQSFEPHPYLRIGQRVRVMHGPFTGWEGVLTGKKNAQRLVVSLEQVMRSVSVDLAGVDVEPAN